MPASAYEKHALITAATAAQVGWSVANAHADGGETWREGGALCVHHPLPENEAHVLFPPRADGSAIDRHLERCGERRIPRIGCWTSGLGDDERLRLVLERRLFEEGWRPHWMIRDVGHAAPLDPRVDPATESRERQSWRLVAREDGEEAGSAWLHVSDMAPFAGGIFELTVRPQSRRRGLGPALVEAACAKALE